MAGRLRRHPSSPGMRTPGLCMDRKRLLKPDGIFLCAIVFCVIVSLIGSALSRVSRALRAGRPLYGLLIGTDWVDNAQHSDTIVFAHYDPSFRTLDLLSIPRDTKVEIPHLRVRKINEVYAYAYRASNRNHDAAARE